METNDINPFSNGSHKQFDLKFYLNVIKKYGLIKTEKMLLSEIDICKTQLSILTTKYSLPDYAFYESRLNYIYAMFKKFTDFNNMISDDQSINTDFFDDVA